jgi:hypothetical protein
MNVNERWFDYHLTMRIETPQHNMCLKCFRKRWPHGRYSSYQSAPKFRRWEVCCFCLTKNKDGLYRQRESNNRELKCGGVHVPV